PSRTHNSAMPAHFPSTSSAPPAGSRSGASHRFFWKWWRKQTPTQQHRYATRGPLVSVPLLLSAILSAFWYLRNEELDREQGSVKRETEVVQQQIRLRMIEGQEQLLRLAREISVRDVNPEQFQEQANDFVRARPEVIGLTWSQADGAVRA